MDKLDKYMSYCVGCGESFLDKYLDKEGLCLRCSERLIK